MSNIHEPARQVPVALEADVAVCGGGPAGIAAALTAARSGARTVLIEQHGCLGGIWTAGSLSWLLDTENKPGLMREIIDKATQRGARAIREGKLTNGFDVEQMKLLLDDLCLEAGIEVRLHTHVVDTRVDESKRLTHAIIESKSGREAVAAQAFIDCTGDGDLAARAGCGFDMGHPETGLTQPMSLIALVTGLDPVEAADYYHSSKSQSWGEPKDRLKAAMERGGQGPSYGRPTLLWVRDELFVLMANHEYGYKGTDARDLTEATMHARRELNAMIDGLRSLGGIWKRLRIVATAAQIGVREGRRIHGRYTLTFEDLIEGREQHDAVCKVTFPMDIHAQDPSKGKGIEPRPYRTKPYDIPLRALIARDVDGLMMAGRCISGDFLAHSSYRVTGNAVAMGEAAGRVASRAAATGRLPHQVDWADVAAASTA